MEWVKMGFLHCITGDAFAWLYVRLGLVDPIDTGKIADGLYAVKTGIVNFYIYNRGGDYIALDSGAGESVTRRELAGLGINPNLVSGVFLSHSDFDHTGGLPVFQNATVYLSHDEEQMITGKTARKYGFYRNKRIRRPYMLLEDNSEVVIGSIKVKGIETPGHTLGSMSYLIDDSVLFAGDTFTLRKGVVRPVNRVINMDGDALVNSIKKLAGLENVRLALTSHRGYTDDFHAAADSWR